MRKFIIVLCMLLSVNIFSQDISRNTIFAEAIGVTGIYSVNYERLLLKNRNMNFSIRVGGAYIQESEKGENFFIEVNSISMLKNLIKNNYIEIRFSIANIFYKTTSLHSNGLGNPNGISFTEVTENNYDFHTEFAFGYRYQPRSKGMFFNLLIQNKSYFNQDRWYKLISLGAGFAF